MSTIIWLHLSDLHYGNPETGWDAEEIHEKLRVDLKRMEQNHGLQPDLIFFTGDLAFGNIKEDEGLSLEDQFAGAHEFLNIVRTTFDRDVPKENIFLVPGNHDVNRKLVTESQTEWLDKQNDEQKITEMIKQGDQSWEDYVRRLRNYRKFLEKLGFGHLLSDPTRMLYAVKRQVNGITLGIGGFNSAWSSCRPSQEEKGKLWLGAKWQSASIRSQLKDVDFSIALIHHPPNWFVQEEDKRFRTELQEVFQFCLHGHEHEEWVLELENGHTMISAEACYPKEWIQFREAGLRYASCGSVVA